MDTFGPEPTLPRPLRLERYELREVLAPDDAGQPVRAIQIVVHGGPFPARALEPEILVGRRAAARVQIVDGGAGIRGLLDEPPAPGDEVVVRYGGSQEGRIPVRAIEVRPLPKGC